MVATGEAAGTRTVALLTSMDEPLGRLSGNWVEVWECVDILKGIRHPPHVQRMSANLIELSTVLAGWMLFLGKRVDSPEAGATLANQVLQSGAAYKSWLAMVELQGGDVSVFEDPAAHHKPHGRRTITADRNGFLAAMDCTQVGWAVQRLGAGRTEPGQPVAAHAGIEMHVKLGDRLTVGQPICTLFSESDKETALDEPEHLLRSTFVLADTPPAPIALIREIITAQHSS